MLPNTMSTNSEPQKMSSGIQTAADGTSYIPSSKRADGSTRKEIRIRPGYTPPEDVQTYKNRNAEAFKNRGVGGVPGAETILASSAANKTKSKNAKRRENARKSTHTEALSPDQLAAAMKTHNIDADGRSDHVLEQSQNFTVPTESSADEASERQRKLRNHLKKLKAVRELKERRLAGEKLSHDQLVKVGKEDEIIRDLKRLDYDGPEIQSHSTSNSTINATVG